MRREHLDCDVAIIGAGPAGSLAAIELARAGRRVMLIEKKRFPRSKACGGCLSAAASDRLQALIDGLGGHGALPGVPTARITFVIGAYRLTRQPQDNARLVCRGLLDAYLAEQAAAAGAQIQMEQAATIQRCASRWQVHRGDQRIRAGTILLAGGLGSLPKALGIAGRRTGPPMIAQQWIQPTAQGLPEFGAIEMHWLRGGYVGLATPQPGRCVVALAAVVSPSWQGSALQWLRRGNPAAALWSVLSPDDPHRHGAQGCAGFPWIPAHLGRENLLLIGDLAGFAEPYSGAGIAQAMTSGSCAAQAILAGGDVASRYRSLIHQHHRRVLQRTRLLSRVLQTPWVHALAQWPILPPPWLTPLIDRVHTRGLA